MNPLFGTNWLFVPNWFSPLFPFSFSKQRQHSWAVSLKYTSSTAVAFWSSLYCLWLLLSGSFSICSSFCWRLLFDRKIIFLLWWSSHYLTSSGEEQREALECLVLYMQSWRTGVMHKVKCNFFTSKWDEKGDVLSPDWIFSLFALSIWLPIWKIKIFLSVVWHAHSVCFFLWLFPHDVLCFCSWTFRALAKCRVVCSAEKG